MNRLAIVSGVDDLLDRAKIAGEMRKRYHDAAERLWLMMDEKLPENEADVESLCEQFVKEKAGGDFDDRSCDPLRDGWSDHGGGCQRHNAGDLAGVLS